MGDDVKKGHQGLVRIITASDGWSVGSLYWILDTPTDAFANFKGHLMTTIPLHHDKPIGASRAGTSAGLGAPQAEISEISRAEGPRLTTDYVSAKGPMGPS